MRQTNKLMAAFIATVVMVSSAMAQAPQKMSYQCVVRNAGGALVVNQTVSVKISLLQSSATGTVVYAETHQATTNANGLASLQIGAGTVLSGSFASINWAAGSYFVKTETDPTGGSNYSIAGTTQLLSVAYALYAANSGTPGPTGATGATGSQGIQGVQGVKGDKGDTGLQGIQGIKGDKGDTGIQGLQGIQGLTGAAGTIGTQGIQGVKGDKGDTGNIGLQGATGAKGDSGVSIRGTAVSGDSLHITLSNGQTLNAGNIFGGTHYSKTYSAIGTSDVSVVGGPIVDADMPEMVINFTPKNDHIYMHFSMNAGSFPRFSSYKILLDGVSITSESWGAQNEGNFTNVISNYKLIFLVPNLPHTLKVQYSISQTFPNTNSFINTPSTTGYYRQLIIEDKQ